MNYPRGSEWRKWDLHVHTPDTRLNNQFSGKIPDEKWENYIKAVEDSGLEVIAVTNYFCISGYEKVLDFKSRGRLENIALVLPNIEFRLNQPNRRNEFINIHAIFSDSVKPEAIRAFLSRLELISTGEDQTRVYCDDDGLSRVGYGGALVEFSALGDRLKENFAIRDYMIVGVARGHGAFRPSPDEGRGKALADEIDKISDFFFGRGEDVEYFLNTNRYNHAKQKPVVLASDAHELEAIGDRFSWIKADPTFEGLRQVINEPVARVFIGEVPTELAHIDQNRTKYIDFIRINRRGGSSFNEVWFGSELTVPLNPGLVAVIGRKGSGKSALADTIALLGDVPVTDSFSFLNERKFRDPRDNKARHYEAELHWLSGESSGRRGLDADADEDMPLSVKYIPQNYLEEICNEIETESDSSFTRELEEVVFSHVEEAQRLRKSTLEELIKYRTSEVQKDLEFTKRQLGEANKRIAELQENLQTGYGDRLRNKYAEKERELRVHLASKPKDVDKPVTETRVQSEVDSLNIELVRANAELADLKTERKAAVSRLAVVDRLIERIRNFEREFKQFKTECQGEMQELGINFGDVVTFGVNTQVLDAARQSVEQHVSKLDKLLDPGLDNSKQHRKLELEARLKEISADLDAASSRYQEFVESLRAWEGKKAEIEGDAETPGSLKYYAKQLSALEDEVPKELNMLLGERTNLAKTAFLAKRQLAEVYTELYAPVQDFIRSEVPSLEPMTLAFDVFISCEGFKSGFLEFIHKHRQGSFKGLEEGSKAVDKLLEAADMNTEEGILSFLDNVISHLEEDKQKSEPRTVAEQIKESYSVGNLYDYIFSLDYLKPKYRLKWAEKTIEQLSPGERGTLLLVFYLLIDKRDIPLVIDQPEENLDNQTVYQVLVPCIKEARRRRQVIIVTHNPNLAVVCDAEQVIHSYINREENNKVTYTSGAIENPIINRLILDVLEGTRPAFNNRDSKYMG